LSTYCKWISIGKLVMLHPVSKYVKKRRRFNKNINKENQEG
jgi:hypothetical protein